MYVYSSMYIHMSLFVFSCVHMQSYTSICCSLFLLILIYTYIYTYIYIEIYLHKCNICIHDMYPMGPLCVCVTQTENWTIWGSDQVIHLIRRHVRHMDTVTKTRLVDALQRQHDFYVNRLQQELVVELLESTTGDELRMMLGADWCWFRCWCCCWCCCCCCCACSFLEWCWEDEGE